MYRWRHLVKATEVTAGLAESTCNGSLPPGELLLFHGRTRAFYVYNGCLAWYNVVLTPRIHSSVKYVYVIQLSRVV